jgi:hypothetical protein
MNGPTDKSCQRILADPYSKAHFSLYVILEGYARRDLFGIEHERCIE